MSATLTKIKDHFLTSRKARDTETSAFLSTLIGEIEARAELIDGVKTVSESVTIKILKSFEKKNAEFLAIAPNEKTEREKVLLESFMPQQLSETEVRAILVGTGITEMGKMMAYLKGNFDGLYDGKTASKIAKELSA